MIAVGVRHIVLYLDEPNNSYDQSVRKIFSWYNSLLAIVRTRLLLTSRLVCVSVCVPSLVLNACLYLSVCVTRDCTYSTLHN